MLTYIHLWLPSSRQPFGTSLSPLQSFMTSIPCRRVARFIPIVCGLSNHLSLSLTVPSYPFFFLYGPFPTLYTYFRRFATPFLASNDILIALLHFFYTLFSAFFYCCCCCCRVPYVACYVTCVIAAVVVSVWQQISRSLAAKPGQHCFGPCLFVVAAVNFKLSVNFLSVVCQKLIR